MSASPPAFLFSLDELAVESVGKPYMTGVSTGERLLRDRPDLHRACVELLKRDAPVREIKRITGLHHRTIEAVKISQGSSIDTARKELGARCLMVAALGIERLEEVIADGTIKPGELSMAVGILIDKGQVLTGGVTARVEAVKKHEVAAGLQLFLESLPMAEMREIPHHETSLERGNETTIAIGHTPGDGSDNQSTDNQSTDIATNNSVDGDCATDIATVIDPETHPALINRFASTPGGEGVASDAGPQPLN